MLPILCLLLPGYLFSVTSLLFSVTSLLCSVTNLVFSVTSLLFSVTSVAVRRRGSPAATLQRENSSSVSLGMTRGASSVQVGGRLGGRERGGRG